MSLQLRLARRVYFGSVLSGGSVRGLAALIALRMTVRANPVTMRLNRLFGWHTMKMESDAKSFSVLDGAIPVAVIALVA